MALETFKIISKQTPTYLQDLITIKQNNYSFRYTNMAVLNQVKTTRYGINSFRFGAARLWNNLPQHIRDQNNINQFRSLVASWDGGGCCCSSCRNT